MFKNLRTRRITAIATLAVLTTGIAATQVGQIIKVLGIGALVSKFGPQINDGFNKLTKHKDTSTEATKVVPILTVGTGRNNAIGAVQVMGPKAKVDKVKAVAQLEARILGDEVKIRALIPVASEDLKNIQRVDGVGVSGIVDVRL